MSFSIKELLKYALDSGASDLHLSVGNIPMLRIHGEMKKIKSPELDLKSMESIRDEILNSNQKQIFKEGLEIDFSAELKDKGRFRVNFFNQINGLSAVFRTISNDIKSSEELGIPPLVNSLAMKDRGLILLTGPTGSGKSTTLAAMIDHINENRNCHIITIEDPVEYYHTSKNCLINQREVGHSTHSFANALRSALREDPDVILVGEMRDLETISLALTAAETGHLVFGTLHASNVSSTVTRILDVFPPSQKTLAQSMLAGSIRMVLSQQLLKKKGGGRIGCFEVMTGTTAIRNLIREGKTAQITSTLQTSAQDGMITMEKYLEGLQQKGLVD